MRVDSLLLGSGELSHSRVWFKLDHLGPSFLGEEKPASVAASEARIRCGWRSPHPLRLAKPASVAAGEARIRCGITRIRCGRKSKKSKPASVRQVKPASVAAEPASIAVGKARIRAAGEDRIRCGISPTHNGSPKVYVRYYKNDVYI